MFDDYNYSEDFLKKVRVDVNKVIQSIYEISCWSSSNEVISFADKLAKVDLNGKFDEKKFCELKNIFTQLQSELKRLPYSSQPVINKLCKMINTLLEKLADFFKPESMRTECSMLYINSSSQRHHFNFFHPFRGINTSIEDLLVKLTPFSVNS